MVDATIVPVPKQRNSRDENDEVKAGKTPEAWEKNPAKNRQKDKDARWTKKHGKSFYGYKNHVNADASHKLIRQYDVTDASVHDETAAKLSLRGLRSRIHHRANRNHPLSQAQESANRKRAEFEFVSSTYSVLNRTRRAAGSHGRSASRGLKPKSACRTLPTTSAGW
jgi:IS5 family transposase